MQQASIDHLGIRHETDLVVTTEKGEVPIVVCILVKDGTLREIFSRIAPLQDLALPPEVVDAFKKQHWGMIQDEDHATLFYCGGFVANLEHDDDRGGYDRNEFILDLSGTWCAKDGHQVVIPAKALHRFARPGIPS